MSRDNSEMLAGNACVQAATTIASALIVGIDECQSNGHPLSQVQQIDLFQAALMAFDGHHVDIASSLRVISQLHDLAGGAS